MSPRPLVIVKQVKKLYDSPAGPVTVLDGVDLSVAAGEYLAITGRSGSGKSTLLNLVAGLDQPSSGSVTVGGERVDRMSEAELAAWRGAEVGVVFQFFQLLPTLTVAENVMLPMDFIGRIAGPARRPRALKLLSRVGLAGHGDKFPSALSGGEQQRVAIARALANDPTIVVADEPTGNLDSATATAIHQLFSELVAEGRTVVEVTHERIDEQGYSRVVNMEDGRLVPSC